MLTKRQAEIYSYISSFIDSHGYAPSIQEIGDAHGLSSLATVHKHLVNLEEKGYVKRQWNHARAITLHGSEICPTCGEHRQT